MNNCSITIFILLSMMELKRHSLLEDRNTGITRNDKSSAKQSSFFIILVPFFFCFNYIRRQGEVCYLSKKDLLFGMEDYWVSNLGDYLP